MYNNVLFDHSILEKKLENCARELELKFPGESFEILIVGGVALMFFDDSSKTTNDIDVIRVSDRKIWPVLENYSMNSRVTAYMDSYSADIEDRSILLENVSTDHIKYYVCSLEDIVAAKLGANRDKDAYDIKKEEIVKRIDFELLDHIIFNELKIDYFSTTRYKELIRVYINYKQWYKENYGKKEEIRNIP